MAECTVKVSNDFGNFGFDYMAGEELAPRETMSGRMALDVGEGSALNAMSRAEVHGALLLIALATEETSSGLGQITQAPGIDANCAQDAVS